MKVAVIQMISTPQIAPNLASAERLLREAAAQGAQLAVLPEYFPFIGAGDAERLNARETQGHGPIQDFLAEVSRRLKLWLVAGSIPLRADDPARLRNSCLVFDDLGQVRARYDKIHLFGFRKGEEVYDEAATIEAGSAPVVLDLPWGRLGLGICYDLRFPELFRRLGAIDFLALPAAFTETTGRAHWELLLRARAVENQCYVLAAAQGGLHPTGRMTHGNSMIVDPWGEVLGRLDKGEGVVVADLDPARLAEVREALPALRHRVLK
ncbi:MAG: carbon-nitrogen hydrolase family protein [Rhodocyclaceae bacterium]|jgi:nitrilase|nr:carbon-nitrogen hydrolase family protein [Rhodocyclaceae bacterium]